MCNLVSILKRILVSLTEMSGVAYHASFFFHDNSSLSSKTPSLNFVTFCDFVSFTFNFKLVNIIIFNNKILLYFVIMKYRLSNLNMNPSLSDNVYTLKEECSGGAFVFKLDVIYYAFTPNTLNFPKIE